MELRARTEKLAEPRAPTAMPPVSKDTALISGLENDTQTHRFLRGVMCFLAFVAFMLSVFDIENYAGSIVLHVLILLLSLAGEVCLYFIFRIKARFAGFTNPAMSGQRGGQPSHVSVLHSPYLGRMCFEMLLWIIQCPPGVPVGAAASALDSFLILRAYVFVMYLAQLSSRSVFKRAMGTLCGVRFDSSFVIRYNFLYHSAHPVTLVAFTGMWMCIALLHGKAENKGFGESLYFCFNTATFVGYGDYAPRTFTGRISAAFSLCLGLVVLAWSVAIVHRATKLSAPERNMHSLFHTNKLCAAVPGEAARVIQRAWKLYVAKREQRSALAIQFNAFWLTAQAVSFRSLRRQFTATELAFLRSTATFDDALSAMTPTSSRATSPATSPRTAVLFEGSTASSGAAGGRSPRHGQRRPFSTFQTVKSKESLRTTPRAADPTGSDSPAAAPVSKGGVGREGTMAPHGLRIDTGLGPAAVTGSASAGERGTEVAERMQRVEHQLDELILRVQRLTRLAADRSSLTEVAS